MPSNASGQIGKANVSAAGFGATVPFAKSDVTPRDCGELRTNSFRIAQFHATVCRKHHLKVAVGPANDFADRLQRGPARHFCGPSHTV